MNSEEIPRLKKIKIKTFGSPEVAFKITEIISGNEFLSESYKMGMAPCEALVQLEDVGEIGLILKVSRNNWFRKEFTNDLIYYFDAVILVLDLTDVKSFEFIKSCVGLDDIDRRKILGLLVDKVNKEKDIEINHDDVLKFVDEYKLDYHDLSSNDKGNEEKILKDMIKKVYNKKFSKDSKNNQEKKVKKEKKVEKEKEDKKEEKAKKVGGFCHYQ